MSTRSSSPAAASSVPGGVATSPYIRGVSGWDEVSRDQFLQWADTDGAPSMLPELFRRLVYETGRGIEAVDVAAGSGVTLGGFDAFVRANESTPFIPDGPSGWELSVNKKAPRKAAEDYVKRDRTPDDSPLAETTYVQLIARPWTKAVEFARTHCAERTWREVRAYNVDRLASWIEQAPATRLWFLEKTGRSPLGARSAAGWWERWSTATGPALTPEVVLARKAGVEELRAALATSGVRTVCGPVGLDELVGCIAAAAVTGDGQALARAVFVQDRTVWVRLLAWPSPLVLVAADPVLAAEVDPATPHCVLIPVPHATDGDVVLDAVDSAELFEALRASDPQARYEHATLARRSFVAFRRRLAQRRELMRPGWGTPPVPRVVRAALLLTGWHDARQADRDIVAALAGVPYEQAREQLLDCAHGADPLIAVTGQRWHLVSPLDAWLMLGPQLLADDLTAFESQARTVLAERDPALDLSLENRWRASIEGKERQYSASLRTGVASGLALLGTTGPNTIANTGRPGEQWAAQVLRPLLDAANADPTGETWAGFSQLLPLLAEAAPREVLRALATGTAGSEPVLATLFQDDPNRDSLFSPGSPHTSILWALETLAWDAAHLTEVTDLLGALATIDPGGRLTNRPAASLTRIFCAWHPETAADISGRLAALDRLRSRHPAAAWDLLISLLPTARGIHFPSSEPVFRDWKPARLPVPTSDYSALVRQVLDRVISDVGVDPSRWGAVLDGYSHLPDDLRPAVIEAARALPVDAIDGDDRHAIWEAVRRLVARHREYTDSTWALASTELDTVEAAFASLRPTAAADRHRWLFQDRWPKLGDLSRRDDFSAYDAEVDARRASAITEITATGGLEAAVHFAQDVEAGLVGVALADAFADAHLEVMLAWLAAADATGRALAHTYLWRRARGHDLVWARAILDRCDDLDPYAQATLLLAIDEVPGGSAEAARRGTEVDRAYWRNFSYFGRGSDFPDVIAVAGHLCRVGRPAAAVDMLAMYSGHHGITLEYAEAVAVALEEFITQGSGGAEAPSLKEWDFERLFACLDQHEQALGQDRVIRLQWYLFPTLGYEPPTTSLHRRMGEDPGFFLEIVALCFRRNGEPARTLDATALRAAENAHRLLDSWSVPPGTDASGRFDVDRCVAWIDEARRLLDEAGRPEVGRQCIGHVLAHTPPGEHGWPTDDVADLIERLDDDQIDRGIALETYNGRGVTTRGVMDGGVQEWELVSQHRAAAQRFRDSHPRVARIHDDLADDYAARARDEDREAELTRRGLDR